MNTLKNDWKTQILLTGAIAGILSGLLAGYLLIQRAESNQERPRLSAGEGIKVGLGLLGLLKLVSDLGNK